MHLEAALGPTGSAVPPSPQPESGTPRLGTTLGRYVIERRLGQGGMGAVYAARDPELDRKVALKLLHPGLAEPGSQARARLRREAQSLARLSHPAVVGIHDVGTAGDHVFIAMELVEGSTLSQWLDRARRTVPQILEVFVRAGEGLAAAHRAGLVHRDFKPDNVIVKGPGDLHLIDFGLALPLEEAQQPRTTLEGTLGYLSPEEILLDAIDIRSDVYSFAILMYACLTGAMPLEGANEAETMKLHVQSDVPDPRERVPTIPASMAEVVVTAGACDPDARYESFAELSSALRLVKA